MKLINKIILMAILLGVLYYIFHRLDLERFYGHLTNIKISFVLLILLCLFIDFLLWNLRWRYSLKGLTDIGFFKLFQILMAGVFVNNITPGAGTGGEPIRVYYLSKFTNANRTKLFALTILEKLFSTFVFGTLVFFSVFYVTFFVHIDIILKSILLTLILLVILLTAFLFFFYGASKFSFRKMFLFEYLLKGVYHSKIFSKFLKKFKSFEAFHKFINKEIDSSKIYLNDLMRNKTFVFNSLIISLFLWLFNYLSVYLSFLALHFHIKIIHLIVVYSISVAFSDLSIIPGGIGLMEAISIGLFNAFGIPLEIATLATLLNRVVYYFFALGIGYMNLAYLHFKFD